MKLLSALLLSLLLAQSLCSEYSRVIIDSFPSGSEQGLVNDPGVVLTFSSVVISDCSALIGCERNLTLIQSAYSNPVGPSINITTGLLNVTVPPYDIIASFNLDYDGVDGNLAIYSTGLPGISLDNSANLNRGFGLVYFSNAQIEVRLLYTDSWGGFCYFSNASVPPSPPGGTSVFEAPYSSFISNGPSICSFSSWGSLRVSVANRFSSSVIQIQFGLTLVYASLD